MTRSAAKRIAAAILVPLLALPLGGCWNYRELETLAIVAGFAVDKQASGGGYHLTFEIIDASGGGNGGSSGQSGGGQSLVSSKLIETDGITIFDAVRNALKKSDQKLYFGHCKTVVISNQLAAGGISPLIDWIDRDSEPRLTLDIFISKMNTAKEILEQKSVLNPITSYALETIDGNDMEYLSKAPFLQLYKVNNVLGGQGCGLALPALQVVKEEKETVPEVCGAAVFRDDELLGFMGPEESKYLEFVNDQVRGGLIVLAENATSPDITLEIKRCNVKRTVQIGSKPKIKVDIKLDASLDEMASSVDFDSEYGLEKLEKDAEEEIVGNINKLIRKAQKTYDSDIFGFGSAVYKSDPGYWREIRPHWDTIFKTLDVEVSADVKIKDTALMKDNIIAGD